MLRRLRLDRISAWIALSLTVVFVASLRYGLTFSFSNGAALDLAGGGLRFQLRNLPVPARMFPAGPASGGVVLAPMRPAPQFEHQPLYVYRHHFSFVWGYTDYSLLAGPSGSRNWESPLWPVFVVCAGYLLWRKFRRAPPGHCRVCRYDLRGLAGDVCPECGARGSAASVSA